MKRESYTCDRCGASGEWDDSCGPILCDQCWANEIADSAPLVADITEVFGTDEQRENARLRGLLKEIGAFANDMEGNPADSLNLIRELLKRAE